MAKKPTKKTEAVIDLEENKGIELPDDPKPLKLAYDFYCIKHDHMTRLYLLKGESGHCEKCQAEGLTDSPPGVQQSSKPQVSPGLNLFGFVISRQAQSEHKAAAGLIRWGLIARNIFIWLTLLMLGYCLALLVG